MNRNTRPILISTALLAVASIALHAGAQIFPENPTSVWSDDFEYTTGQTACWGSNGRGWEQWVEDPWYDQPGHDCKGYVGWDNWLFGEDYGFPGNADNGVMGTAFLQTYVYCSRDSSMLVPQKSLPGHIDYDPSEWTNVSLQFDFYPRQFSAPGIVWGMTGIDQTLNPEQVREPADGYAFYLDSYEPPPNDGYPGWPTSAGDPDRMVRWRIARIEGTDRLEMDVSGVRKWQTLASGLVQPDNPSTVNTGWMIRGERIYTLRLDWYCGNFRVRYAVKWGPTGTHPDDTIIYGCASATDADGVCCDQPGDVWPGCMEDCWCTIIEGPMAGIDPNPVIEGPGAVGIYNSGAYTMCSIQTYRQGFDNFRAWSFGDECGLVCSDWCSQDPTVAPGCGDWQDQRTDVVPFKYLYEGALLDFSAGRNVTPAEEMAKIDVDTEAPAYDATYNHSLDSNPYCNGWNLLEDLPGPSDPTNFDDVRRFLDPMTSAVKYQSSSGFSWVDSFDNDPVSPNYDPVPLVADGTTPINASLHEAFDWYVDQKTNGAWATDSYEDCRNWYVVLITDGEEGCEFEPCSPPGVGDCPASGFRPDQDRVCEAGQAASKFANPGVAGVPALPVYTIGFSESIAEDSPLQCIADQTGGLFLTAENAGQLANALYEVFYNLETRRRSFSPFKVAPPPPTTGGNPTQDSLAVFPLFQPQEGFTLWGGTLYGFPLNSDQPTLPVTGDCQLDTAFLVWDASDVLDTQLAAHSEGNPKRFVYMGSDTTGDWARHDLATLPDNATLMNEWKDHLGISGITDPVAQQVANFVRNIYMDNDFDPSNESPPPAPRPDGYPAFGEFYHSQPVIVNPPNSPRLYYDYGFGDQGYGAFITEQSKRRRLVVAGANDGMLHIFDGGFWDRDRGASDETYNEIHDLGTGIELAAWVPQAVMHRLYYITAGGDLEHSEPEYLVDGLIAKGDVRIDADGDGDREWRTMVIATMRRGGRGMVALDLTQPDPTDENDDYKPTVSDYAGCRVGTTSGCGGFEWPRLMWEFSDENDADTNCPGGLSGDDCAPYWDLGWTWSKPAIARIAKYGATETDDEFIAFFGGGWDKTETDATGRHFYGVDVATGNVVVKEVIGVDLPGGVTALDSDVDGFHDRIYFADTNGGLWRLQYRSPDDPLQTGATAGTLTKIFDFSGNFTDRQEFFTRPVPVPVIFDGTGYTWALAFGSGDRANLKRTDSGIDHFYFVIDGGDTTTRNASLLTPISYADLDGSFTCPSTTLDPSQNKYGWYLTLRDTEKVMFDATVIDGYVLFPTFDPSTATASHNVPDQCPGSGAGVETPNVSVVCRASGVGRTYKLWFECGLGDYSEHNDVITGSEDYTIGGDTYVTFTGSVDSPGATEEFPLLREHSVTNWRQE